MEPESPVLEIVVTQSDDGKLSATPKGRKRSEARPGETVIWIFKGDDLIAKNLKVRSRKDPSDLSKTFNKPSKSNWTSGQPIREGELEFEYEVVEIKPLEWQDRGKGECVKQPDPPPGKKKI